MKVVEIVKYIVTNKNEKKTEYFCLFCFQMFFLYSLCLLISTILCLPEHALIGSWNPGQSCDLNSDHHICETQPSRHFTRLQASASTGSFSGASFVGYLFILSLHGYKDFGHFAVAHGQFGIFFPIKPQINYIYFIFYFEMFLRRKIDSATSNQCYFSVNFCTSKYSQ